jgi:protein ImuB
MPWIAVFMPEVPLSSWSPPQALSLVSQAALAFTPQVSVWQQRTVLLEVQASLRLFGGLEALARRLGQVVDTLIQAAWQGAPMPAAVSWRGAVAPTPLSAAWLAQWAGQAQGFVQTRATELKTALSALPVQVLAGLAPHQAHFEHLGLHSLGHVWRLPRSGLSRRFGPGLLDELDRALGLKPDPQEPLVLPESFEQKAELWEHTDSTAVLLDAAGRLLVHLGVWLLARQALVSQLALHLHPTPRLHRVGRSGEAQPIVLALQLAQPTRDVAHLALLLRERLQRLSLREPLLHPVAALSLHTVQLTQATTADAPSPQLFPVAASAESSLARLVERLQARLGVDRAQGLTAQADHRPERATQQTPPHLGPAGRRRSGPDHAPQALPPPHLRHGLRPACLLPQPQALALQHGQPCMGGQPLRLLAGPERIETGWWVELSEGPGLPTQRDYYVAELPGHALVWVFREGGPGSGHDRWFLHGHFG